MAQHHSTFEEIPVIDFTNATSTAPDNRRALASLIRDACNNVKLFVGFFYLKNHGISEERIQAALGAGKNFFDLPRSKKMELSTHKSSNFKGYTDLLQENTNPAGLGDVHEGFDLGWEPENSSNDTTRIIEGAMSGPNVWPDEMPGFKDAILAYYHSAIRLGRTLFTLFALALDLPENFFDNKITRPAAIMRILHYPPQDPENADSRKIGIGAHTDYEASLPSCFTILWQDDVGGLQIQNNAGKWIKAEYIPGTLVVNIGDQFARWTNDVFKSTMHRAINYSGRERYSIPLFFGTDYDVLLEPIPTCVSADSPAKYEVVTAGEYVKSRLEATYIQQNDF